MEEDLYVFNFAVLFERFEPLIELNLRDQIYQYNVFYGFFLQIRYHNNFIHDSFAHNDTY